jgi:glycosyltransferase involved in cell wall biosynthesis
MKICHFIASSLFGGAERVVVNLCNEISKTHDVYLISFDSRENLKDLSYNVTLHTFKEFKRYNIFALYKLAKLIKQINPDIVNAHGAKATRIIYNIQNQIGIPFVGTKHNARKGKIFNRIKHVIAVSKDAKKSVKHKDVKVIYNGIEPVEVEDQAKSEVFTLLAVGRLDKIKGFDILIRECSKLTFPYLLQIVGEGKEKASLLALVKSLNLEEKVKFLGFRDTIPQLMCSADVVVMSSHSEGFSLVMIESLFYANIFISTKVSGATEILDDKFLINDFHIADKLNEIHQDKEKYKQDFSQLRDRIKDQFLLENIAKEYVVYYQEILKENK